MLFELFSVECQKCVGYQGRLQRMVLTEDFPHGLNMERENGCGGEGGGCYFLVLYPDQREVRAFSILSPSLYGGQAVSGHSSLPVWALSVPGCLSLSCCSALRAATADTTPGRNGLK